MEVYPICAVCASAIESLDHILLSCLYAQQCWQLSQLSIKIVRGATHFQSLVDAFADMNLQDLQFFCCGAWNFCLTGSVVWNVAIRLHLVLLMALVLPYFNGSKHK